MLLMLLSGVWVLQLVRSVQIWRSSWADRWRFRDKQANNPRAFLQANDQLFGCTAFDGELGFAKAVSSGDCKAFQTVSFDVVNRQWRVVGRHRWLRE